MGEDARAALWGIVGAIGIIAAALLLSATVVSFTFK